ncbi:MAG: NAD(+)/NADH kinase [Bacteroidales bacterium]|nr:NAD(+)/NADH kinase [Candidatus Liminaster caballi]
MKIALFGAAKPEACEQVKEILRPLSDIEIVDSSDISADDIDMALSIGGDGTFLRTAAKVGTSGAPILGVNAGRLGFLADVQLSEAADVLPKMLTEGRYDIERRALLDLEIPDCCQSFQRFALNEVAVLKRDVSSMVSVSVYIDGTLLNQYDADGLVIATPTGSTAYAMSAGGPILEPQSHCFAIVPIAPHSLTSRPLVIRDCGVIDVKVKSRNNLFLVAIDGLPLHLTTEYSLRLTRAGHEVGIVRRQGHTFFDTLRQKLMWGVDIREK